MFWINNHHPGLTSKRRWVNYCLPWWYKLRNFRQHREGSSTVNIDSRATAERQEGSMAALFKARKGTYTRRTWFLQKNEHVLKWNNWNI